MRRANLAIAIILVALSARAQTPRIASDFEIQQMQRQAAASPDFVSQISAHMNLGALRQLRNETSLARAEFRIAADVAARERSESRKSGQIGRYATATVYAGLAAARLGRAADAFALVEESIRYAADDPRIWNVYASAMRELHSSGKAVSVARNAVDIQTAIVKAKPSMTGRLDLAMYQTTLAMSLNDAGEARESQQLLESVVASLQSDDFDALRKDAARRESFEIYTTVVGDTAAYVALLNRSQLQLAGLYEQSGDFAAAKRVYRDVLKSRNDDATALTALARLTKTDDERAQFFADAFDANPFSVELVDQYQEWLETHPVTPNSATGNGAAVRRALEQMAKNENRAARATLEELAGRFPSNDVVQYLAAINDVALGDAARARMRSVQNEKLRLDLREYIERPSIVAPAFLAGSAAAVTPTAEELRSLTGLLAQQRLTPEQRVALDRITFTTTAVLDPSAIERPGQTVFESGSIDGLRFRFSEPTAFSGTLPSKQPLRFSFRVLGTTEAEGSDALLVEPVKLEVIR